MNDNTLATNSSVAEILQDERSLYSTQLTLGFRSLQFIPELEEEFREYYLQHSPGHMRRVLPVALALTILFTLSNYLRLTPELFRDVAPMHAGQIICLALLTVFVVRRSHGVLEWASILTLSVYGISTPIFMGTINQAGFYSPIAAQLFIIVFCYFLSGLRFFPAIMSSMVVSLSYPASQALFDSPLPNLAMNCYFLLLFNLLGITGAYYFEYAARENFLSRALMQEMALYDSVTGLPNQRAFVLDLDKICRQARREAEMVSVAMVDVDNFKEFNAYFGYPQGDYCLRKISSALRSCVRRPLDIAGRYGGEELVLAWYGCGEQYAGQLAENVRKAIASLAIPHGPDSGQSTITVSIGVASSKPGEIPDRSSLMRAADRALALAKDQGRDRVVTQGNDFSPRPV